jgi:hypothetical protein
MQHYALATAQVVVWVETVPKASTRERFAAASTGIMKVALVLYGITIVAYFCSFTMLGYGAGCVPALRATDVQTSLLLRRMMRVHL